jgi:GntR family transcriptional repressor for pyruvate dehydrogenase complex
MALPQATNTRFQTAEDVVTDIQRRIQSGEWPAGYRLPPERELAALYGLARNTVRSALTRMGGDLIRVIGRGTYVRAKSGGGLTGLGPHMKDASPAEVMEVRLIIEPQAAALAAHRANSDDLAEIEEILRRSIVAKGFAEFEHYDAALHLAVFRATKNQLLIDYCEAINSARHQPHWHLLKQKSMTDQRRSQYDREHSALVDAIKQRDAEKARRLIHQHLSHVRDSLLAMDA